MMADVVLVSEVGIAVIALDCCRSSDALQVTNRPGFGKFVVTESHAEASIGWK